jgi:hypothetical protein
LHGEDKGKKGKEGCGYMAIKYGAVRKSKGPEPKKYCQENTVHHIQFKKMAAHEKDKETEEGST